jgi:hypothetical protein
MGYTILITLVVDFGGLLIVYLVLRDRVRRASSTESRIAEIREEVSRLLVELNQATDRNIALMEDKIAALNEAISTADKKIGLLRRETEKHDVGSQIYSRLAEGRLPRASATPAERSAAESRGAESAEYRGAESAEYRGAEPAGAQPAARRRAKPAEPRGAPAAPPLAVELSARAEPAESAEYRGAAGDVRERVMMLSRAGFSPSLIASRVGVPLGEVELIISLEQRKGQA